MNNYHNYTNSNVKYLRESKNIPQKEMAKQLKIDQSTLAKWENNTRQITIEWCFKLAEYFNVFVGDFISKDLRLNDTKFNQKSYSKKEEINLLKNILKEKGFLNDNEELTEETFNELIDFAIANKKYIIKNKK